MDYKKTSQTILDAIGGKDNLSANGVCATRLRLVVDDPSLIKHDELRTIDGLLGVVTHGESTLELVFGPRAIAELFDSFSELSGLEEHIFDLSDLACETPQQISVNVSPGKKKSYAAQVQAKIRTTHFPTEDKAALKSLLSDGFARRTKTMHLLVINGPNINLLGMREPELYGSADYKALIALCKKAAKDAGFGDFKHFQSNYEGAIVDEIQQAYPYFDGIVINPAAYTHTSIAILDALKAVQIPAVEVHISKVNEREDFRKVSFVREYCIDCIEGEGIEGYRTAIHKLADYLKKQE